MIRLKEKYAKEVVPKMMEKFGYKSPMAVPRVEKGSVNTGFGKLIVSKTGDDQKKTSQAILDDLSLICGQGAVLTKAKKAISSFKLRKGMAIGARATLRSKKMYDFLERMIHIGIPRVRDFRGIDQKSFDEKGNLTLAIKEHTSFSEISPEKVKNIFSFEMTAVTTAKTREEGMELLKLMGFPIKA